MASKDHSIFELERDYYLGNYQSCINKANSMPSCKESTFYMCLSYFQLKRFDFLEIETKKSSDQCTRLVYQLYLFTESEDQRETILDNLEKLLQEKQDNLSRLIVSSIFCRAKSYQLALRALHQLDCLPTMLSRISIYLVMNRLDLAEQQLKLMQKEHDNSTLTKLATAQVRLMSGHYEEAYSTADELERIYGRATPLIKNIQTAAAIGMSNYDCAKEHCEESLDMDNDNLEALINIIHVMSKLKLSTDIKERQYSRLKTLYPENEFVKEVESLEELVI